jgi:oxygen-independent coproporphyrinogen III oxidase
VIPSHLYVHVPFCARRCSYCDFAIAVRRDVPVYGYLTALEKELELKNLAGPTLDSLYLGGGTPSRLGGEGISRLIGILRGRFQITGATEITLEANPDDVDAGGAKAWREAGVNRVSLGIQSFDDAVLRWMHRVHDADSAAGAFRILRDAGFDNISVDLIFALPDSLNRSWENDVRRALSLGPEHISLYGLTIEKATPLARWNDRGDFIPADEDRYASDFLLAHNLATDAGYDHYEVSNFARPGRRSRHNSAYWTGAAYAGVGPSAHSYDGSTRSWNVRDYAAWADRLARGDTILAGSETLSDENRLAEKVYLGLRTSAGLSVAETDRPHVDRWQHEGWATRDGDTVRLTSEGWLRLDSLASALTGL